MRSLCLPIINFGTHTTLDTAFDIVFGEDTLRSLHGEDVKISQWDSRHRRTLKFTVNIDNVPAEIRRVFCGSKLRITAKQQMTKADDGRSCEVNVRMRMHFIGAELIRVKPRFTLKYDKNNRVCLEGRVDHSALLPPPVNMIAETFMSNSSRDELGRYANIIRNRCPRSNYGLEAASTTAWKNLLEDWNRASVEVPEANSC
jgi:hypothetical protein